MKLRDIFRFLTGRKDEPVVRPEGWVPAASSGVNLVICNDFEQFHRFGRDIQDQLRKQGHDITIHSVYSRKSLLKYLDKLNRDGAPAPTAFFLDVIDVGAEAAREVIDWYEKNYPGVPLPEINFLSQDLSMAITEASHQREEDARFEAGFIHRDELEWVSDFLHDMLHPQRSAPVSSAFREMLNDKLKLNMSLSRDNYAYDQAMKEMLKITNNDSIAAWQRGKLTAAEVIERLRGYTTGVVGALRSGFYGAELEGDIKPDVRFYGSAGFPMKGRVVFSLEEVERTWSTEKPVLVMHSYEPAVVPLLASGKLGGLIVASPYMASHLKLLCETHMVSGLFGVLPAGKKGLKREFNEEAEPLLPPYFFGDSVEIGGLVITKGQEVLVGLGGDGLVLNPPANLKIKALSIDEIDRNLRLRQDIKNLDNLGRAFAGIFAERGVKLPGVKANIESSAYRVLDAVNGIGLVRTEQMVAAQPEQVAALKAILLRHESKAYDELFSPSKYQYGAIFEKLNKGNPVKVRLFDFVHQEILTRDEQKRFLELYPKLEMHGGEALVAWPQLYSEQIRAIFNALKWAAPSSTQPLEIMMPAVRTEEDVEKIKDMVIGMAEALEISPAQYSFGVMVETLEACRNIAAIAPHCDFISFGTNDLTQQSFDMARSDLKAHARFAEKNGFDPFKKLAPDILKLMEEVTAKARAAHAGIKVDVCGAQAADPETAMALHKIGVDNISVAPSLGNLYGLPLLLKYKVYDDLLADRTPAVTPVVTPPHKWG